MSSSRTRWVVACAAGMLVAGCNDGPSGDTSAAPKIPSNSSKPGAQLPADMVAAVSSVRNANVVGVHFVLNGTPTVLKPLPVEIAIVPHEPVLSIDARFEARDGLALATGDVLERQADPRPEAIIKHQLVLLPSKEGVFMVTAIVETETNEGAVSRVFSIPVIVAAADAAAGGDGTAPATNPASR
jgi:hypothetical protein